MTPSEPLITSEEKKTFDMFGISMASMLSFGEESAEMDMSVEDIRTDYLCLFDAKRSPEKTLVGDRWTTLLNPLVRLRTEPHEGRKVEALKVRWVNEFDCDINPFGDVGFFLARAYSLPNTQP